MKPLEFKKLIKETVKEAIHEELKELLLEAIKSSRSSHPLNENYFPQHVDDIGEEDFSKKSLIREMYKSKLGDPNRNFTTEDVQVPFRPISVDTVNGALPPGEVSMDQIFNILNAK